MREDLGTEIVKTAPFMLQSEPSPAEGGIASSKLQLFTDTIFDTLVACVPKCV